MKLKSFFNSERRKAVIQELKSDFKPILGKVTVPVTTFAKNNPRTTFALMIIIVITNIIVLFFFTDSFKRNKGIEITDFHFQGFKYGSNNGTPEITVSFENIKKVKVIRDSLAYLMSLKNMTFQDTLTFIRMMDQFQQITSGSSGMPPLKLQELRRIKQINKVTNDTIIKK